jgi:hypothetical protein
VNVQADDRSRSGGATFAALAVFRTVRPSGLDGLPDQPARPRELAPVIAA